MVDIIVNHTNALEPIRRSRRGRYHCYVVKDTEACALSTLSMVACNRDLACMLQVCREPAQHHPREKLQDA